MRIEFNFCDKLLNNLWIEYQVKRESGLKKNSNKILIKFIDELNNKPNNIKEKFLEHLLRKIYDEDIQFELQYPLLKHIIFPKLLHDYIERRMPGIRWLYQIPYIDQESSLELDRVLKPGECEEILLLALEVDKEDQLSQKLLLHYYLSSLEFGIHEVPYGLLNLGVKAEIGYELIGKVKELLNKFNYEGTLRKEVNYMIELYEELFTKWNEFKSQNEIKDFGIFCDRNKFDYVNCKAQIMNLGIIRFR